jgi:uncharacterized membrane protein
VLKNKIVGNKILKPVLKEMSIFGAIILVIAGILAVIAAILFLIAVNDIKKIPGFNNNDRLKSARDLLTIASILDWIGVAILFLILIFYFIVKKENRADYSQSWGVRFGLLAAFAAFLVAGILATVANNDINKSADESGTNGMNGTVTSSPASSGTKTERDLRGAVLEGLWLSYIAAAMVLVAFFIDLAMRPKKEEEKKDEKGISIVPVAGAATAIAAKAERTVHTTNKANLDGTRTTDTTVIDRDTTGRKVTQHSTQRRSPTGDVLATEQTTHTQIPTQRQQQFQPQAFRAVPVTVNRDMSGQVTSVTSPVQQPLMQQQLIQQPIPVQQPIPIQPLQQQMQYLVTPRRQEIVNIPGQTVALQPMAGQVGNLNTRVMQATGGQVNVSQQNGTSTSVVQGATGSRVVATASGSGAQFVVATPGQRVTQTPQSNVIVNSQ